MEGIKRGVNQLVDAQKIDPRSSAAKSLFFCNLFRTRPESGRPL